MRNQTLKFWHFRMKFFFVFLIVFSDFLTFWLWMNAALFFFNHMTENADGFWWKCLMEILRLKSNFHSFIQWFFMAALRFQRRQMIWNMLRMNILLHNKKILDANQLSILVFNFEFIPSRIILSCKTLKTISRD